MKRAMLLAMVLLSAAVVDAELFEVEVETGSRTASTGDTVKYNLFIPREAADRPAAPWPTVVLLHGFARSKSFHATTARHLAERGFIVLTPNQVGLGGIGSRETNIAVTLDHLAWLRQRGRCPGDPLDGLVDPRRSALVGHSAGGAVVFEAAVRSQSYEHPVGALLLLDAVPWRSTLEAAPELTLPVFGSLRSEPSSCNAQAEVRELLEELSFAVEDVLIVGATHCDPESPTDLLCRLFCGGSGFFPRYLYFRLTASFLQEALNVPPVEPIPAPYGPTLERLEERGLVVRETID